MSGALRSLLDTHLDTRRIARQGILNPQIVAAVRQRFEAGDPFSVQRVWLLLAFQLWHARWMENDTGATNKRPVEMTDQLTGFAQ
jgi:hypothetical protein